MEGVNPKARLRIGISGWRYGGWRGTFYPEGLAQRRELEYASERINSIEINGSFYSLQTPASYQLWHDQTPRDFQFAVKGGRFITHMKRLKDIEAPLGNFFASGVLALKEKLGPFLWQFPPQMQLNMERFGRFFEMLPKTAAQAAEVALWHDERLKRPPHVDFGKDRRLRHAVEIRNRSFLVPEFGQLLRKHNIAWVIADTAGNWPYGEDVTADFVYCRLHGETELYASGYTEEALQQWAGKIRNWSHGRHCEEARCLFKGTPAGRTTRDIYVYFDNDAKVRAPFDALRLSEILVPSPTTGC